MIKDEQGTKPMWHVLPQRTEIDPNRVPVTIIVNAELVALSLVNDPLHPTWRLTTLHPKDQPLTESPKDAAS